MNEVKNNLTLSSQIKEFALNENITPLSVNIHDIESIEGLIGKLSELEDTIHEYTPDINIFLLFF
jgi:hypothetical protein